MKFRATFTGTYEVPDDRLLETYGSTDPQVCAAIDAENDTVILFDLCDDVTLTITPVNAGPPVWRDDEGRYFCIAADHRMNSYDVASNTCWYCTHPDEGL